MVTFERLVSFGILAFQTILITAVPKVLTWTINVNFLCNVYISISITYLDSLLSKKNMILVFFFFFFFFNFLSQKYTSAFPIMRQRSRLVEAMAFSFQLQQGRPSQVFTFYQAAVQSQVRWAGFRLESGFDV